MWRGQPGRESAISRETRKRNKGSNPRHKGFCLDRLGGVPLDIRFQPNQKNCRRTIRLGVGKVDFGKVKPENTGFTLAQGV